MNTESENELRAHWDARYRSGQTPWDTGITPPEVLEFWREPAEPSPGAIVLDIGCGTGLNTLFLARQGLRAVGFDLSGQALRHAIRRLDRHLREGPFPRGGKATFVQADVSRLPIDRTGGRLRTGYWLPSQPARRASLGLRRGGLSCVAGRGLLSSVRV